MQKLKIKSRKTIHDSKTRVRWSITIQKPSIIDISISEEIFFIIWYIPTHLISNIFYLNNTYDPRQKFSNKIQQKLKIRSRKHIYDSKTRIHYSITIQKLYAPGINISVEIFYYYSAHIYSSNP